MVKSFRSKKYFEEINKLLNNLEETQQENIELAGSIISESIVNGGILQAFGSGHSYAAAIEISGRAGGLIPSKAIIDPAEGEYEKIEGVGIQLSKKIDIEKSDCFVIISNSGRNPLSIELAKWVKDHGNKLIVVTSLDASKKSNSRHSSGKKLYEYAD